MAPSVCGQVIWGRGMASELRSSDRRISVLIDDQGNCWPSGSRELFSRLGNADPDFDMASYAVRNLGFIEVEGTPDSMQLRLRPGAVDPKALAALFYLLSDATPRRLVLGYFIDDWGYEICPGSEKMFARIEELVREAANRRPNTAYLSQRKDPAGLVDSQDTHLSFLFAKWRATFGTFHDGTMEDLATLGLLDRTLILDYYGGSDILIIQNWGKGLRFFGSDWTTKAPGHSMENQPDRDYAAWVARGYRESVRTHGPVFEQVDAVIRGKDKDPLRREYERLILPWRTPQGDTIITGCSALTRKDGSTRAAS